VWASTAEIDQLKASLVQNPNNVRDLYKLGAICYLDKRYREAIDSWKRLLKLKNVDLSKASKLKVYKGLALAFAKIGDYARSLRCIKIVCKHAPEDPKAERFRTRVSILLNNARQAQLQPNAPASGVAASAAPVKVDVPDLATAKKKFEEGEDLYKQARILLDQSQPIYEEKFTQAIKCLEVAVAGNYQTAKSLYYLGSARLYRDDDKENDRVKARECLENSLKKDTNSKTYFDLAQIYGLLDLKDKEIESYEKALELQPDWADCHFRLALAYDKSKRPDAARKTFENAKAAIRLKGEYKKKFQEVLKNSEVAKQIAGIVSEIIEKSENDQLTDQETEKYAKKFQEMLGDKNSTPDQHDKEKLKDLMDPEKRKELFDKMGVDEKMQKMFNSPGGQKLMDRMLKKSGKTQSQ